LLHLAHIWNILLDVFCNNKLKKERSFSIELKINSKRIKCCLIGSDKSIDCSKIVSFDLLGLVIRV
jgi:hypothetical protein